MRGSEGRGVREGGRGGSSDGGWLGVRDFGGGTPGVDWWDGG